MILDLIFIDMSSFYMLWYSICMSVIEKLKERELVYQTTAQKNEQKITGCYIGFDATAESLQVGNLLAISFLRALDSFGVPTIAILGGATTKVGGDPTDKNEARKKIADDQIEKNIGYIRNQIKKLLPNAKILNNADWIADLSFAWFMENILRNISVAALTKLEMFANRLSNHEPLSVTEMLYPVMQGYDFLYLYENENCNMEAGGSDQWCNILSGVDMISKKHGAEAIGVTIPLLTTADGKKMGKSVSGAVYLSDHMCSVFDFWQFWRNIDDSLVKPCLKKLTLIDLAKIDALCADDINQAKIALANDITTWVHSEDEAKKAEADARLMFVDRRLDQLEECIVHVRRLIDIIVSVGAAETNGEAKRLIEQNAVRVDDMMIDDRAYIVEKREFVLSVGKKKFFKVLIQD